MPLDRNGSHLEIFFVGAEFFDLLGDPIPPEHVGRGRPPHVVTDEKRFKVMLLLALEKTEAEVAAAIGISDKTLRKHYSRQLKVRDDARLRLEGEIWKTVAMKAATGDTGAIRELNRMLDKHDQVRLSKSIAQRPPSEEKASPLGKKEKARQAAHEVDGMYAPPAAPNQIN
ncbi:hypothetical protein WP12_17030 [Sphingomonas sp. SRS2]|nr:hypothetical protein WP12_17030 [Sphingomonas sp. SRS2]